MCCTCKLQRNDKTFKFVFLNVN
uniref:Uncharacterized protein n=1 Tax=Anguilla anguilla TaxID=7936 RepID=A0A0E9T7W1_ANGAN